MSLIHVSFLEGLEHDPTAIQTRPDSDSDGYEDLPSSSAASSFPSTCSRVGFHPYAGPGWNEHPDDPLSHRAPFLGPSFLRLSPTTTRDGLGDSPEPERPVLVDEPQIHTTNAYEVNALRRIVQIATAVLYCFFGAGIVFGFAALKPVLIREKVYRNFCSQAELEESVDVCDGQEIRLNMMFTIAAVVTNVSALPVGTILDAYGPRVCGISGSICLAVGATLFSTASKLPFDGYTLGYSLLALGGPFLFLSSFHLSNTFPKRSGLVLSMLTGAFDASSAMFLFCRLLTEHMDLVSVNKFFAVYLVVPTFIMTMQIFIMPATSYKTAGELIQHTRAQMAHEVENRITYDTLKSSEREPRPKARLRQQEIINHIQSLDENMSSTSVDDMAQIVYHPNHKLASTDILGVLHGQSVLSQIRTPWFILITAFTVLMMLRMNYFIATICSQYTYLFNARVAKSFSTTFDVLLPVGGIISVPLMGTLLDIVQTRTVLIILVLTASIIGVLGCIPQLGAAYGNIIIFVVYRPFFYTAISDYAAKAFGFATFGKVYGLIICLAGAGNFAQAGLDMLTLHVWQRNPVPVNVGLTMLATGVGVSLAGFVAWKTRERGPRSGAREPLLNGERTYRV